MRLRREYGDKAFRKGPRGPRGPVGPTEDPNRVPLGAPAMGGAGEGLSDANLVPIGQQVSGRGGNGSKGPWVRVHNIYSSSPLCCASCCLAPHRFADGLLIGLLTVLLSVSACFVCTHHSRWSCQNWSSCSRSSQRPGTRHPLWSGGTSRCWRGACTTHHAPRSSSSSKGRGRRQGPAARRSSRQRRA